MKFLVLYWHDRSNQWWTEQVVASSPEEAWMKVVHAGDAEMDSIDGKVIESSGENVWAVNRGLGNEFIVKM